MVIMYVIIYVRIENRITRTYKFPNEYIEVKTDSATVAKGRHLAVTKGCLDCHGNNLAGKAMIEDPAVGYLYARNLTRGKGGLEDH
jgi:mono/diheme cytochrome c family protein